MRKLGVFNSVSLDGYFTDRNNDVRWAHRNSDDPEWNAFVESNSKSGAVLVFGRVTYELMASWWPTPAAAKAMPVVAEQMNKLPKVVFSQTLEEATWSNSELVQGDLETKIRALKSEPGDDLLIMGSGTIIAQLAATGLIDEYEMVVIPVVLGSGRTMFDGLSQELNLELIQSRAFANGNLVLSYRATG